jgi:hypothetical protein
VFDSVGHVIEIIAAAVTVLGGGAGFFKWGLPQARKWLGKNKNPQYEYCNISCKKEAFSLRGYYCAIKDDGTILSVQEKYDVLRDINPFSVAPNNEVQQHVDAYQRMMGRLQEEGWEYVGQYDLYNWYSARFRRQLKEN